MPIFKEVHTINNHLRYMYFRVVTLGYHFGIIYYNYYTRIYLKTLKLFSLIVFSNNLNRNIKIFFKDQGV